jgi:hypothetical protein
MNRTNLIVLIVVILGFSFALGTSGINGVTDTYKTTIEQATDQSHVSTRSRHSEKLEDGYLATLEKRTVCISRTERLSVYSPRVSSIRLKNLLALITFSVSQRVRTRYAEFRDKREDLRRYHAGVGIPRLDSEDPLGRV